MSKNIKPAAKQEAVVQPEAKKPNVHKKPRVKKVTQMEPPVMIIAEDCKVPQKAVKENIFKVAYRWVKNLFKKG